MSGPSASIPPHRRLRAALALALIFMRELALSSLAVARLAFARAPAFTPAIIAVPVDLRTDLGVATVANLISLTPGTTSLHVGARGKVIYVHCLDAPSAEAVIAGIESSFEKWVREVEG